MWYLRDYKNIQNIPNRKLTFSLKVQAEYNCWEKQEREIASYGFAGSMAQGAATFSNTEPTPWKGVFEGSVSDTLSKYACAKGVEK